MHAESVVQSGRAAGARKSLAGNVVHWWVLKCRLNIRECRKRPAHVCSEPFSDTHLPLHLSAFGQNMHDEENEPTNAVSTKTESSSAATRSGDTARALIRRAKRASRRRFPSEEKIRILLEGVRAEVSVAELCRREGIHPTVYYKWLKDFMEAGKNRLRGDTKREATSGEVEQLRQENERLKQLVADLSLANMTPKKSQY